MGIDHWGRTMFRLGYSRSVRRLAFALPLFALGACAVTGCTTSAEGPRTVPVSGKITYQGAPVSDAVIVFYAEEGREGAVLTTQKDGTFKTPRGRGLMAGEYRVSVAAYKRSPSDIPPRELEKIGDDNLSIPKKYTKPDTSALTFVVKERDSAKISNFELTD